MNMVSNRVEYKDRLLSYQINWPLPAFRYFLAVGSAPGEEREETSQILFSSIWSHRAEAFGPNLGPCQLRLN